MIVDEGHVDFPLVEGLGRPQACHVKRAEIEGTLEARAFQQLECPVLAFILSEMEGHKRVSNTQSLDGFAGTNNNNVPTGKR